LTDTIYKYSTYCTVCKTSVNLSDIKFVKLANNMAAIEGNCTVCRIRLIKGKIMPKTGKNPLQKYKRKKNRENLNPYNLLKSKKGI
jgi:hypothetical protein